MTKWIKCSERLPEVKKEYLVWDGKQLYIAKYQAKDYEPWYAGEGSGDCGSIFSPEPYTYRITPKATHWAELPEPPND